MLFFVSFGGEVVPMLVDAESEAAAREMVIANAEGGRELKAIKPIACGVFIAELFTEDEDGNDVVCAPLDEIVDLLEAFDEEDDAPPESGASSVVCGDEGDYEGETVVCTLPQHAGEHKGTSSSGEDVTW